MFELEEQYAQLRCDDRVRGIIRLLAREHRKMESMAISPLSSCGRLWQRASAHAPPGPLRSSLVVDTHHESTGLGSGERRRTLNKQHVCLRIFWVRALMGGGGPRVAVYHR